MQVIPLLLPTTLLLTTFSFLFPTFKNYLIIFAVWMHGNMDEWKGLTYEILHRVRDDNLFCFCSCRFYASIPPVFYTSFFFFFSSALIFSHSALISSSVFAFEFPNTCGCLLIIFSFIVSKTSYISNLLFSFAICA